MYFFFNDTATTEIYTLSLHDALPILIADIHFRAQLALDSIGAGASGLRINPGNIGSEEKVRQIVETAGLTAVPIRIGVNAGSLPGKMQALAKTEPARALAETVLEYVGMLEGFGYRNFKVSAKSSSVRETIDANLTLAEAMDYPIHLGVTEAGTRWAGGIKSAVGIGALLAQGVGDTIRVSLTGDPVEEVRVAYEILQSLGLRKRGPSLISCPTCGRTEIDIETLALEVERRLEGHRSSFEVAVMGCVVNGPGEARRADYGIAGGKGEGLIFAHGEPLRKVPADKLVDALFEEIEKTTRRR